MRLPIMFIQLSLEGRPLQHILHGSGLLNHFLNCIRPSQSRLYRPTDSFEDLSIVTTDLQSSLGREKVIGFVETFKKYLIGFLCQALEDKLINIKNIVIKHSESADFSGTKTFKTDENLSFFLQCLGHVYVSKKQTSAHVYTLLLSLHR